MEALVEIGVEQPRSVEDLARAEGDALLRYAYQLTGSRSSAEEIVQSAYLRLLKVSVAQVRSLPAYARSVVLNEHRRRLRKLWNRPAKQDQDMPEFESEVALRQDLWRALHQLPPKQRAALILRHYEDLPDAEIAAVLGCSRSNVRSLAARALKKLKSDPSLIGSTFSKELQ